jgi:hypothetical protein
MHNASKHVFVFSVTAVLFVIIFLFANFFYDQRLAQIQDVEKSISQNILESEIQYALLADASCDMPESGKTALINEINSLAVRLSYMEDQRGVNDAEVIGLKKYYSLLQIKDYLLLRERAKTCGERPLSILYFYTNTGTCTDCAKMGHVLTAMRREHENLHIYAFDYDLGLSTIETLKSIYGLTGELPVLVVNRKPYYGFKTREEVEALIPELGTSTGQSATGTPSASARKN